MADWEIKQLGDICQFVRGPFGGSLKKDIFVAQGFAVYEQQHAIYDQFDDVRYYVDKEKFSEMQRFELRPNDLIMSCSGTMGRVAIAPAGIQRGIINQALLKITPTSNVLPEFLKYWMTSAEFQQSLAEHAGGAAIQNVASVSVLKHIKMPLPSYSKQRRIVAVLDEAFEGIATAKANAQKNLQNARELFDSQLDTTLVRNAAGYEETTLGAEVDLLPGYAFSSGSYSDAQSDVRLLRGDNIMQGYLRWEDAKRWPASECVAYAKFNLRAGDVVLAMDRPWVKAGLKRAQISSTDLPCLQVQRTARLRPMQTLREDFLFHLTGSQSFSRHLQAVQTGIGVPHISGKQIESFKFMRPPVREQAAIASSLSELYEGTQRLVEVSKRKIAALEELKKSLLHQAFSGQL